MGSSPWGSISQAPHAGLSATRQNRVSTAADQPAVSDCAPRCIASPTDAKDGQWNLANFTLSPHPWTHPVLPTLPLRSPIHANWYQPPTDPSVPRLEGPATPIPPAPGRLGSSRQVADARALPGPGATTGSTNAYAPASTPQQGAKHKSTVNRKPYRCG